MTERPPRPLVLDTHVWLWMAEGDRGHFTEGAIREIERAAVRGTLVICAISVWEVAMLEAKGRITLSRPLDDWIQAALRAPGTRFLDLTPEVAIESARLPGTHPKDPADRMLIASARILGGRVATRDRRILDYAEAGHVAALDVSRFAEPVS